MAKTQMNLRIDEALDSRLDILAKKTGRSKAFYATEAIEEFLDDHEDYFLAKDALAEFRNSDDSSVVFHEDVDWDALGR
jgi:RHH-type rel operon transcriptional repressor/antitoxin RelB